MIEFLFQTILQIVGFIFKCTIGLLISIFTEDYRFKPVVITLLFLSVITAIILSSPKKEAASSLTLEEIEGNGSVYEKDARQIAYIISQLDLDVSVKKLLKKYSITNPEYEGDRLVLKTIKNKRGQEIVLEAIMDMSEKSIEASRLKGFNVMFRNDLEGDHRNYYSSTDFSEMYSALLQILNTSGSPDNAAKQYPVYVFWDMCCNTFSFTIGEQYWEEAEFIGVSR